MSGGFAGSGRDFSGCKDTTDEIASHAGSRSSSMRDDPRLVVAQGF
jgi:hypothetical protein